MKLFQSKMDTKKSKYWDLIAKKTKSHHLEKNIAEYKRREHIQLIKKWAVTKNKTILKTDLYEEMFRTDSFMDWLQIESRKVYGIDISSQVVAIAKTNYPSGIFQRCNVTKLCFKNDFFDLIISNSTLDHLKEDDVRKALKEMTRVLKPTGTIILTLDNKENKNYYFFYQIRKLFFKSYYQDKCYSLNEVKKLTDDKGLIIKDVTSIVHILTPFNKIVLMLSKMKSKTADKIIKTILKKLKQRKKNIKTGWFLALKIGKWQK